MERVFREATPLPPEDERLVSLYVKFGMPVDSLVSSSRFQELVEELRRHGDERNASEIVHRLFNLRKASRLPRLVQVEPSPARVPRFNYDVFVSYAPSDREIAKAIVKALSDAGLAVYTGQEMLRAGQDWGKSLRDALMSSREVCLIVSPQALASAWIMAELGAAWALGKPVVPVLVSPVRHEDMPPPLAVFQAIDLGQTEEDRMGKIEAYALGVAHRRMADA